MSQDATTTGTRRVISSGFTWLQDVVYIGLGLLLGVSAVAVLVQAGVELGQAVPHGLDTKSIVSLLDRILLALMIVELLYTVQVSFREHVLVPEPFVLVALIAAVRRILVITAEFGAQAPQEDLLRQMLWELALLAVLVVVFVGSLVVLRGRESSTRAEAPK